MPNYWNPLGNPKYPGYTTCAMGPNWLDLVLTKSPANTMFYNFAHGGATVDGDLPGFNHEDFDFTGQVNDFLKVISKRPYLKWTETNRCVICASSQKKTNIPSIFTVWFGTNDLFGSYNEWDDGASTPPAIFKSYFANINRLVGAGAKRIIIYTMDPVDRTPNFVGNDKQPTARAAAERWNRELLEGLAVSKMMYPAVHFETFDTYSLFELVLDRPTVFGAPNATCHNDDAKSCLWTDQYHPGLAIQKVLGDAAFDKFTQVGFYDTV